MTTVHIAEPTGCLNGCHTGSGDTRQPTMPAGNALLCAACIKRLDSWLKLIPDSYGLLPLVIEHGTVTTNPESAHVKRTDPPAPMRLEVVDLLDTRRGVQYDESGAPMVGDNRRGVFGLILAWSGRLRLERELPRNCDCGHPSKVHHWAPPFASLCRAKCRCTTWSVTTTLAEECSYLAQHLAWISEQDWAGDLYAELQPQNRQLGDAVGDYRPAPIGMCVASVPAPGLNLDVLCGGPLYRDEDGYGVHCKRCGDETDVDTLRRLGLSVGLFHDIDQKEAS